MNEGVKSMNEERESIERKARLIAVLTTIALIASVTAIMTASAQTPDYTYEMDLSSDGSDDSGNVYSIERKDDSKSGYIYIEAFKDEKRVNIELENIRKITIYFNETDVDFQKYLPYINMIGADIEINIQSDVSLLDGEFHGVPSPDKVELNGISWDDYTHEGDTFKFSDLEMSTNTITLSYTSEIFSMLVAIVAIILVLVFVKKIIEVFEDSIGEESL